MADKPLSWFITCLLWTGPVWGFSVAPKMDCPTQFRAIASEIIEESSAQSALSKQQVVFSVAESIKGNLSVDQTIQVEFLKFGPLIVEAGKEYLVQLNKGKLCWLESVE